MSKIVNVKSIGSYTLSIYEDGAMTMQAAHLHDPLTFAAEQVQELQQWLSQQKDLVHTETSPVSQAPETAPAESSEEIAQHVINDAIALAREHYPASLDVENRDRFIDQITRDPSIKPLVGQGKVSRKQIMLWIEQRLSAGAPSPWTLDKKRGR